MAKINDNGLVMYEGKSRIPGQTDKNIVAILTGLTTPSSNEKTGPMLQLWILTSDVDPVAAMFEDLDCAVCGDCPMRKTICYVNVAKAPLSIWKSYKKGQYMNLADTNNKHLAAMKRLPVRLGAYGDPAALPLHVITEIVGFCNGHTGYTHQWKHTYAQGLKHFCMASVENLNDMTSAHNNGWKTFRVHSALGRGIYGIESTCANSSKGIQCRDCLSCNGCNGSISIAVHGGKHKENNFSNI